MRYFPVALLFFVLLSTTAHAKLQERPYVPETSNGIMSNLATSATTGFIVSSHEQLLYNSYTQSQSRYQELKGTFGENLMDEFFSKTGGWQRIESAKVVNSAGTTVLAKEGSNLKTGLDGIYVKFDKNGNPKGLMVGEAKANGSKLSATQSGKQMSPQWINERLAANAERIQNAAKAFNGGKYKVSTVSPPSGQESTTIPNGRNGKITFWYDKEAKQWKLFSEPPASGKQVAIKLETLAKYLNGAAEGKIIYRARIFMVDARTENIRIRISDAKTGALDGKEIVGKFNALPVKIQNAIRGALKKAIIQELSKKGRTTPAAEVHADKMISDAQKTGKMHELINKFYPKIAWYQKLLAHPTILGGVSGGVLAGVIEMGFQAWSGHMDWGRVAGMTVLGTASGKVGTWGGIKMEQYLAQKITQGVAPGLSQSAKAILSRVGGGSVGGGIASVVFAYGAYAAGYMDRHEADRAAISGLIGTGVGTGLGVGVTSLISAFGTAGTGAAISGLSGAAATNATLAVLGGGTLASGGLGAAGGAMILSGGTVAIAIAATVAITSMYKICDAKTEEKRVFNLVKTLRDASTEEIRRLEALGVDTK